MPKLLPTVAGWFAAHPPESVFATVDDVPPAGVSAICISASPVLVKPKLPHPGMRSVARTKSLFAAVRATFEHSRCRCHRDRYSSRRFLGGIPTIRLAHMVVGERVSELICRDRSLLDRRNCLAQKGGGATELKSPASFSLPSVFSSSQTTASFPLGLDHRRAS